MGAINNSGYKNFDGYTACLRSNSYSVEQIMDMVEELSKEYNIDKSNIVLAGYSEGANKALKILSEADGYFSKGLIISAGTGSDEWIEKIKETGTEVKGIVGEYNYDYKDGANPYMTGDFAEHFETQVINTGHDTIREEMIKLDADGDNRSDIYEWIADEDFDAEEWITNGYSENATTKNEESNSTQSTDVNINSDATQNSQETKNDTDSKKTKSDEGLKRLKVK